jgi:bacterioferritin-associated ferredoxin
VRVTLTYRDAGGGRAVIADAAARCFGSAIPIAPASALMEIVVGRTPEEAASVSPATVLRFLADGSLRAEGLPPRIAKGAEFAVEALRRALGETAQPADPSGPGVLVCRCIGVGDRQVRTAIRGGARTPEDVEERCGAGAGCRSCRPDLLVLLQEERAAASPAPEEGHPVERICYARVKPVLLGFGVALESARVDGDRVGLGFKAVRSRPDLSTLGALEVARHLLRETVWDEIRVSNGSSGVSIP